VKSTLVLLAGLLMTQTALADNKPIRLATTTSTANSGLLDAILPEFEKDTGQKVHVIAVGTGKALRMGRDGDVDVLMVHAPPAEQKFVAEGHGDSRRSIMYNDFVIVGPASDPAGVAGMNNGAAALTSIAQHNATFVSRGDDSGTHKKELGLWKKAGIAPSFSNYREAGQGMGKVLQMADELQAYTMTDRGTWLASKDKSSLKVLVEGDAELFNPYSVMTLSHAKHPDLNHAGAQVFADWITSDKACHLISAYQVAGSQLFHPDCETRDKQMSQNK